MKRTIFYSWQSDLPNNTNRGFIESCIEKTVKKINKELEFNLEMNIDRDTKSEIGTPNITESIFRKIDNSKIFIADISIINSKGSDRKCPNPNVLIELGYATRVLGWERVFCFYNTDYGSLDDLPFDLKQRRPILYSLKDNDKSKVREKVSNLLAESIIELYRNGGIFDIVDDYTKQKVDTQILSIGNHLSKLFFGYTSASTMENLQRIVNISEKEIQQLLIERKPLGFQAFKSYEEHQEKLSELADKAISSIYQNREIIRPILNLLQWVRDFDFLNSPRRANQLFKELGSQSDKYVAIPGSQLGNNTKLPNRYILLDKVDSNKGVVLDFGDFLYKPRIEKLTTHFSFNCELHTAIISSLKQFNQAVEDWLDLTNNEIIIDTHKNFEIKIKQKNESV